MLYCELTGLPLHLTVFITLGKEASQQPHNIQVKLMILHTYIAEAPINYFMQAKYILPLQNFITLDLCGHKVQSIQCPFIKGIQVVTNLCKKKKKVKKVKK